MGRKHALPILMFVAGCVTVFVTVGPRHGQATISQIEPDPAIPLGTLEGRDYGVRIEATPEGPRYTVVDAEGVVVAERLPLETLAERYPLLTPSEFYANDQGEPLGPLMIAPDDGLN